MFLTSAHGQFLEVRIPVHTWYKFHKLHLWLDCVVFVNDKCSVNCVFEISRCFPPLVYAVLLLVKLE